MEYGLENNVLIAKLENGEDIFESLEKIMNEIEHESAVVLSGIGMLRNFKVGFYNSETGDYEWEEFTEPKELLSLKGSITKEGSMHLHVEIGGRDHNVYGGHLEGGKVFNVTELAMLVFKDLKLSRKKDEELDMYLLSVG
ncbi:MAG: PPC domain-containing DNA-binding protein [Candidatus Natronoplasma sp.]